MNFFFYSPFIFFVSCVQQKAHDKALFAVVMAVMQALSWAFDSKAFAMCPKHTTKEGILVVPLAFKNRCVTGQIPLLTPSDKPASTQGSPNRPEPVQKPWLPVRRVRTGSFPTAQIQIFDFKFRK
jgi:hypothetical protein